MLSLSKRANRLTPLFAAAALFGCATVSGDDGTIVVSSFAEVDKHVGSVVTVEGIVSLTHEASGLYFRRSDMHAENGKCVRPHDISRFRHGEQVKLRGLLERTECGKGTICLNVCDGYILVQPS